MKKVNYYKSLLNLKKSIAFVLGGSGLIGKEIVLALLSNGAKVVSFDIKSSKIVRYEKTFKLLNNLGDNIDSLSCPHADLRHTFDGINEQVFHSQVHTGDKQNKILAYEISKNIESIIQKDM